MFSTKKRLIERTGYNNVGRYDYLKLLATEFQTSKSKEARKQVLANLSNFAYDPVNYDYMRQLRIVDLFLHVLSEPDKILVQFAIGGICNLCLDPINKEYIIRNQGVQLIKPLLSSDDEQSTLSAITTLMFLVTDTSREQIITPELINQLVYLSNSSNNRIKNLIETGDKVLVVRKVTEDDVMNFAKLTDDYNPIHVSAERKVVHGALLNGFLSGVLGTKLPGPGTIVVHQSLHYPKPCYAGDTIEITVTVLSARKIIKFLFILSIALLENYVSVSEKITTENININITHVNSSTVPTKVPGCLCGIFLSGSKKKIKELPEGDPVITHDIFEEFPNNSDGNKSCIKKCLSIIVKHLPNSPTIICSSLNRDCYKERAQLFIKNSSDKWIRTNLSAGREFCCKDNLPYKC
ncbi:uncharacterized protein LOC103571118 [Microplitis demolitor]|uniref:uncharacterized protein LOC103571118 n=1 Tax=Microplitis demolitor TaxID=69319 RepID=UPI0004CD6666|nr:uncharacterized protein LOC103571118 [Microplitis demolitor]